ncbi:conserved exported protein of unknown function [Petrocella atlantisensis]|uniref:CARDB domain-containing protein n=1 Tax=Petrocella atlantisensis TaxID=2173034 RepID=A0A3P7PFI8_9FIRM|nr:hypothetical protein [Petrocella atlantisensis]VDN48803.1 conserved exported protein of unknown function [Petrocella atlantisensis]
MKRIVSFIMVFCLLGSLLQNMSVRSATDLTISSVSTSPATISAYNEFTITFTVTNRSTGILSQIFIEIESGEYQLKESGSKELILEGNLEQGANFSKTLTMRRVGETSTSIPVKLTYVGGNTSQSDYISVNATTGSEVPSEPEPPIDTKAYQPYLNLEDATFPIVYLGEINEVIIGIKNTTRYQARNLIVTPNLTDLQVAGIRVEAITFHPNDTTIDGRKEKDMKMKFVVDDTVAEGNYPITLELQYRNSYNDLFTQEIKTYLRVVRDMTKSHQVQLNLMNEPTQISSGDQVFLNLSLRNDEQPISSPRIEVKEKSDYFTLLSGNEIMDYQKLMGNASVTMPLTYKISDETPQGWYNLVIAYSYITQEGFKLNRSNTIRLYVKGQAISSAMVSIDEVAYPSSVKQEQPFVVSFVVNNAGPKDIENIKVSIEDNTVFLPKSSALIQVKKLLKGEKAALSFQLVASGDDLKERNYPITFNIIYDYEKSGKYEQETLNQVMGVYVIGESAESISKGVPKIIIEQYIANPIMVDAGTEFDLSLRIQNAHSSQKIYNIKTYLTAIETSETTRNNIFMPVNSSNTFYIDDIGPKGIVEKSIRLYAMPDAQPKTYTIQVNFEYEDKDGNPITATELIGINVKQPTRVEMSDFNLPTEVMMGEMIPIYFDVYNTGKVKVYNLMVRAEGDFNLEPMSKYIGNFEPGYQDYFDAYITPNASGLIEGKIILGYDDPSGEYMEEVKTFSIQVMDNFENPGDVGEYPEEFPGEMEGENGSSLMDKWLWLLIPLLVGVGFTIAIVMKKRRLKKEGMMLDED